MHVRKFRENYPHAAQDLLDNLYVDHLITAADTDEDCFCVHNRCCDGWSPSPFEKMSDFKFGLEILPKASCYNFRFLLQLLSPTAF